MKTEAAESTPVAVLANGEPPSETTTSKQSASLSSSVLADAELEQLAPPKPRRLAALPVEPSGVHESEKLPNSGLGFIAEPLVANGDADESSANQRDLALSQNILGSVMGAMNPHAQKPAGQRPVLVAKIRELASQIIAKNNDAKMLSASAVLAGLQDAGFALKLRGANGIGDCLGKHRGGLNLPKIVVAGKARYALHLATASDAEKSAFQDALDHMSPTQSQALIFA